MTRASSFVVLRSSPSGGKHGWRSAFLPQAVGAIGLLLIGPFLNSIEPSRADAPAKKQAPLTPGKGSARGNGLGRYFVADAVEAAAPAVANITVNVRFHAGRWTPTYATQSVRGLHD